jgi:hypothetical protein
MPTNWLNQPNKRARHSAWNKKASTTSEVAIVGIAGEKEASDVVVV